MSGVVATNYVRAFPNQIRELAARFAVLGCPAPMLRPE